MMYMRGKGMKINAEELLVDVVFSEDSEIDEYFKFLYKEIVEEYKNRCEYNGNDICIVGSCVFQYSYICNDIIISINDFMWCLKDLFSNTVFQKIAWCLKDLFLNSDFQSIVMKYNDYIDSCEGINDCIKRYLNNKFGR